MNKARVIREVEACSTKGEALSLIRSRMSEDGRRATQDEAEKWLADNLPYEKDYQRRIMAKLREMFPQAFVWKAAAGPYTPGGIPDVCAIIDGRYYGFEVKRPFYGRATDLQQATHEKMRRAGGMVYVVSYPGEVELLLQPELEMQKRKMGRYKE